MDNPLEDLIRQQQSLLDHRLDASQSQTWIAVSVEALVNTGLLSEWNGRLSFVHRIFVEFYFTEYLRSFKQDPRLNILLDRRRDALMGFRFKRADKDFITEFLRLQDASPPIPCEAAFPLYAARGSLELLLAFVAVSAAGFALKKFAEGFLSTLGSAAATALRKSDRQKLQPLPASLLELAPPWARNNPDALQSFANGLAEELGRRRGRDLADMELARVYLETHYTARMGETVVVIDSDQVMHEDDDLF